MSSQQSYSGCDMQLPMVPSLPPFPDGGAPQLQFSNCQTPMNGQQSPMSFGQQTPLGFSSCPQGFATPLAGQQSPMSFQMPMAPGQSTPKSQEEMMLAQMMSGAFNGLDGEQVAHQLRAAAPEVYDD